MQTLLKPNTDHTEMLKYNKYAITTDTANTEYSENKAYSEIKENIEEEEKPQNT